MSDTAPDTERSVVVTSHAFETLPGEEWKTCMHCGLGAAAHATHLSVYKSDAKSVVFTRGSAGEPMGFSEQELVDAQMEQAQEQLILERQQLESRQDLLQKEGHKDDSGKTLYFAMPWLALDEMAEVMTFGAQKYALFNFRKGMKYSRLWSATLRHLVAWWRGEENDKETGKSHLAHALCCIGMLLEIQILKRGEDDRCK